MVSLSTRGLLIGLLLFATTTASARTWTSRNGKFKIEATLAGVDGTTVILLRPNGKTVRVPLAKLSSADALFVRRQRSTKTAPTPAKTNKPTTHASIPSLKIGNLDALDKSTARLAKFDTSNASGKIVYPKLFEFSGKPPKPITLGVEMESLVDSRFSAPAAGKFAVLGWKGDGARRDYAIGLFSVRSGKPLKGVPLPGQDAECALLGLSRDGGVAAIANRNRPNEIQLWSLSTGKRAATLKLHAAHQNGRMADVVFPDATHLFTRYATGTGKNFAVLWSLTDGKAVYELSTPNHALRLVSQDQRYAVLATKGDGTGQLREGSEIVFWDLLAAKTVRVLKPTVSPHQMALSIDSKRLAVATQVGETEWRVEVHNLETGKRQPAFNFPCGPAFRLQWIGERQLLFWSSSRRVANFGPVDYVVDLNTKRVAMWLQPAKYASGFDNRFWYLAAKQRGSSASLRRLDLAPVLTKLAGKETTAFRLAPSGLVAPRSFLAAPR